MGQFDLSGRTAIVTGGNGGIGRGLALAFASAGANVCIAARNADKMAGTQAEIEALGGAVLTVSCDVNELDQIEQTLARTTERFGGCDVLVNNAGIAQGAAPQDLADADWDRTIATNLSSVFRFSQHGRLRWERIPGHHCPHLSRSTERCGSA